MSHTHHHSMIGSPSQSHDGKHDVLDVVVVISNPIRYKSRYDLYKKFEAHCLANPFVRLTTVEIAFGRRPYEVTQAGNPFHLQLRSYEEIWHKENMINLGVARLPWDWKYVAWVDADIEFQRKDWAQETIQQLQHYMVVQMFQNAIDLGPEGETLGMHQGFAWSYMTDKPRPTKQKTGYSYPHWHPGYAWAMRREAWDGVGGLYDVSALGSGDHLMAWSLLGENQLPGTMSTGYVRSLTDWQARAEKFIYRDVGFVNGTIVHFFHGKKRDRRYRDRWQILEKSQFDPHTDLKRDWQGVYQLAIDGTPRMVRLRDDIRAYFRGRNEDSIDL